MTWCARRQEPREEPRDWLDPVVEVVLGISGTCESMGLERVAVHQSAQKVLEGLGEPLGQLLLRPRMFHVLVVLTPVWL